MKNIYSILLSSIIFLTGCKNGNLTSRNQHQRMLTGQTPPGMVYVPAGTFSIDPTEQDSVLGQIPERKQFSVQSFYMDETEVTNGEYRKFVNWVRDSVAITDYIQDPAFFKKAGADADPNAPRAIDWDKVGNGKILWNIKKYPRLEEMYLDPAYQYSGKKEINVKLFRYHFEIPQFREAVNRRFDKNSRRSDFMLRDTVAVYPDTLVWATDFNYAQNDPMAEFYFSHPAFANYPVVGVSWRQARAYTVWKTKMSAASARGKRLSGLPYELPSEAEFAYAAQGGKEGAMYPWSGNSMKNAKGCLMANYKESKGKYRDGGVYTVNVRSYLPNDFGLYNMAGNVSEWTATAYDEASYQFINDLNPNFTYKAKPGDPKEKKRKVVKGGSWKDISYFLQNSSRAFEFQDSSRSYIGFRCITHFPVYSTIR